MALEAFREHWRTRHAELIVQLPGLRRYVQNYPLESAYLAGALAFDAVAESSFDDTQAMKALAPTPQYQAVLADEPGFIDRSSMGTIITEEHVLKNGGGPATGVKAIGFLKRRAGAPLDEFFAGLLDEGARLAKARAVRRYVQSHTRRSAYESGRTPAFDAVEMIWLDGAQSLQELPVSPAATRSPFLLASERVVF